MRTVVCDTNFLIKISNDPLPKVDWAKLSEENEFVALPCVIRELEGLKKSSKVVTARRAKMALNVIEAAKKVKILTLGKESTRSSQDTDNVLLAFVSSNSKDRILATLDRSLLSRLEKMHLSYLTLSGGKALIHYGRGQYI